MNDAWNPCLRSEAFHEDLPDVAAPQPVLPGSRGRALLLAAVPVMLAVAGLCGALLA